MSLRTVVTLHDGRHVARKLGRRWGLEVHGPRLFIEAADMHELYRRLIQLCYLTPLAERTLFLGLPLYHVIGRAGLAWVRRAAGLRRPGPVP